MGATEAAVRNMLDYLANDYGLSLEGAHVFCSVADDLRTHAVVETPQSGGRRADSVGHLPLDLLDTWVCPWKGRGLSTISGVEKHADPHGRSSMDVGEGVSLVADAPSSI